jgi:histidyl-tRNA synthetase
MKKGPVTPKGFRDILPDAARIRRQSISQICDALEEFGFLPLETPTIEFADTLLGKYGEEEKLIYQFEDKGGRKLALRYDLTVPLARFIANNLGLLTPTFSRYQIGQCFRGENPQKGRYRELTQFDFDTVGDLSPEADAKVIAAAVLSARKLGLKDAKMVINDRTNFNDISIEDIRLIDKIHKIGRENIPVKLIEFVDGLKPTDNLKKVFKILEEKFNLKENSDFVFDPTLARGLDYYTGTIMELKPNGIPSELSIGGGGRYDNLIGVFAGRKIPAVGFSFGIDRLIESITKR